MKRLFILSLSFMILFIFTACGEPVLRDGDDQNTSDGNSVSEDAQSIDTSSDYASLSSTSDNTDLSVSDDDSSQTETLSIEEDSFFVAYEWDIEGELLSLPSDNIYVDLTVWKDGTARLRQIEGGILINNEEELRLRWQQDENGGFTLFSSYSGDEPYWTGKLTEDGIELERYGGIVQFKKEDMPKTVGELYMPAELKGVWIMVETEIEGSIEPTLPGNFNSLVFASDWVNDRIALSVDCDESLYGYPMENEFSDRAVEILDEPLYNGCGNEEWSVRIGPEAEKDANGHPSGIENYATLIGRDTLLRQQYFTIDGAPFVSYQTYRRILPQSSDWEIEIAELEGSDWECIDYYDFDGNDCEMPEGMSGFYIHFDINGDFFIRGDEIEGSGKYQLGNGGTLLLNGYNYPDDWFAGAVRGHCEITMEYEYKGLELYLCYENGIMHFSHIEGSGGENFGG